MFRSVILWIIAASCWLIWPAAAWADQSYSVTIEGAPDAFDGKLALISELRRGVRDYPTLASLRRVARRDSEAFVDALKAAGYYAGSVEFEVAPGDGNAKPIVRFVIEPSDLFTVTEYEILYGDEHSERPQMLDDATIEAEGSAAGADLRNLQLQFLNHLWESGYPQAEMTGRRAIANMEQSSASVVFTFNSGPKAQFGEIRVQGAARTKDRHLRKYQTWVSGEDYDRSKIAQYRDRLGATGLFNSITVSPGSPNSEGRAPVLVEVEERKRRTIGAGASFSTSEGPGGRLFFENRNIFGEGENLRIELRGSEIEQSINFDAVKPLPALPGQLFANVAFVNETTDAFDARSLRVASGVSKRWLENNLETRGAVALETSNVTADGVEDRTYFVSTPLSILWNSENDLLNPTNGFRAGITVTPYTGTDTFTQTEFNARSRVHFGNNNRFTLAARTSLGATFGNSLFGLPRNKRFYSGGGGSVRGYSFQEAGPLDAENDPIGGRSLIEAAFEARAKVSKNVQIAGFVDAGSVSQQNTPDFNEKFFVGYGGGVRYFTPIGPIRADIAFPLNGRETDRDFQIFIALGQPF